MQPAHSLVNFKKRSYTPQHSFNVTEIGNMIRKAAHENNLTYTNHAVQRYEERGLPLEKVNASIASNGAIVAVEKAKCEYNNNYNCYVVLSYLDGCPNIPVRTVVTSSKPYINPKTLTVLTGYVGWDVYRSAASIYGNQSLARFAKHYYRNYKVKKVLRRSNNKHNNNLPTAKNTYAALMAD